MPDDARVNVRYIVDDVGAAVDFYATHLGFELLSSAVPAFADIVRGNLRLLLSGPTSSAGRPMPDGRRPEPGGWNRIHLLVDDIQREVGRLRTAGITFRSEIVRGLGRLADRLRRSVGEPDRALPAVRPLLGECVAWKPRVRALLAAVEPPCAGCPWRF